MRRHAPECAASCRDSRPDRDLPYTSATMPPPVPSSNDPHATALHMIALAPPIRATTFVRSQQTEREPVAHSAEPLFVALYEELHRLAELQLRRGPELSLGASTLLHEAYLAVSRSDA